MLKRSFIHCGLAAILLLVSSCLFDPEETGNGDDPPPPSVQRMPLTTREAVLNNIEFAWDNRRIDVYEELLDLDFTFFLSQGDVDGGLPEQWDRDNERTQVNYLFISNTQPVPVGPECQSIRMDLTLENLQWVEIIPEDYPDETWYMTPINYDFTFKMLPDDTYNSEPGSKGQFTVRNVGTVEAPHWQLIEWRDLGND